MVKSVKTTNEKTAIQKSKFSVLYFKKHQNTKHQTNRVTGKSNRIRKIRRQTDSIFKKKKK